MSKVPDRWLDYSRYGEVIYNTGILPCKTPLKEDFHMCKERPKGIPPSEEFTPTQLVKSCEEKFQRISLVVDLTTKDNKYYDPKEFESLEIKYAKISCSGKTIPRDIYPRFAEVLKNHLAMDDSGVIVVHCTRGVNRTGYLVCRFLMDYFEYTADNAIRAFNTARGHSMDSEDYIANIHAYWKYSQKEKKSENAPASESHQSMWSAKVPSNSNRSTTLQPHGAYDQYPDHQSNVDDPDHQSNVDDPDHQSNVDDPDHQSNVDDHDDEEKNPRLKGNRESRDQWYDKQDKTSRCKKKNKDQMDDINWGDL